MTPDEIRQLTGPALDAELERVSGLRLAKYEGVSAWKVEFKEEWLIDCATESDARDFIAVKLLQDAERRGWNVHLEPGWCCRIDVPAQSVLCGRTAWGEGTLTESIGRAWLLAARGRGRDHGRDLISKGWIR